MTEEAGVAPEATEEEAAKEARRQRMRELGRKGGQARAARLAAAREGSSAKDAAESGRVALVRVPVPIGDIMRKLSSDARAGDTAAARELRSWLGQFPPDDGAADASDLDSATRSSIASILARALAEHEESPANQHIREGMLDGFDSPPNQTAELEASHPRCDGSHPGERGSRPPEAKPTPSTRSLVDELLAERKEEATRENDEPLPAGEPAQEGTPGLDGTNFPNQMTVDDCIAVAESGSDLTPDRRQEPPQE